MATALEILNAIEEEHDVFKRAEVIENGVVDALYYLRRGLARSIRTMRNKIYIEDLPSGDDVKGIDLCMSFPVGESSQRFIEVKEKTGLVLSLVGKLATGINIGEFQDFKKLLQYGGVSLIFYHHPDGYVYKSPSQEPYDITTRSLPSGLFEIDVAKIQDERKADANVGAGSIICWHIDRFKKIMPYDEFNRFLKLEEYHDLLKPTCP